MCVFGGKKEKENKRVEMWMEGVGGRNEDTYLESLETLLSTGQLGNGAHQFGRDRVEFGAKGAACGRGELRISKRQRHDITRRDSVKRWRKQATKRKV